MVGREAELDAIRAAAAVVAAGTSRVLVVVGEPGLGKTTLLGAADPVLREAGLEVLEARAAPHEAGIPFALAAGVLDDHVDAASARTAEVFAAELAAALPSAGGAWAAAGAPGAGERFRHHRALRALLDHVAGGRPLALVLDDLQWADEPSLEWVLHLVRRPSRAARLLLLAARPGATAQRLLAEARASGAPIALAGLPDADARALLGPLPPADAARLLREAGGNPLFLEELARAAARGERALPTTVLAAIAQEVAARSSAARGLLGAAAVCGDPFEDALAAAVAGLAAPRAAAALDELAEADLVRAAPGRRSVAFRHPLVHRAVHDAIGPAQRTALHERAATELARAGAPARVQARHVERFAVRGDLDAAARLELEPELVALAAQLERLVGRNDAARARLLAVRDRVPPEGRAPLELELAVTAFNAFDMPTALAHARQGAAAAGAGQESPAALVSASTECFARIFEGELPGEELDDFEPAVRALPPGLAGAPAGWIGLLAFQCERFAVAGRLLRLAADAGAGLRDDLQLPPLRTMTALGLHFDLQPVDALEFASAAEEGARLQGVALQAGSAGSTRALCLARLGRVAEAQDVARAALADLEGAEVSTVASVGRAVCLLVVHADDPEALVAGVLGSFRPAWWPRASSLMPDVVAAACATGRAAEAAGWVELVDAAAAHSGLPGTRTRVLRARVELALAGGDPGTALAHAAEAVACSAAGSLRLDGLLAQLALGRAAVAAGERGVALDALERAFGTASAAGADGLAAEAALHLRRAGRRLTARALRGTAGGEALTERERRIAELVARGSSNKEVAAQLFLSAKTVENNLSRVYAKLGVRSRVELAAVLRRPEEPAAR